MLVADYILQRLYDEGIDTVMTLYGGAISELLDAFPRQNNIKYVTMMSEQSCAFAAEGYAKVKGLGCAIATSGPGGQNLITGIANCYFDSVACIFITGQVNTKFIKQSDDLRQLGFQECDIVSMVKPITKWAVQVLHAQSIEGILNHALEVCQYGRKGPVLLDIPVDVQRAKV